MVIEDALSRAAESLGIDHAEIRRINLYGDGQKAITHYGQVIEENRLSQITEQLFESAAYEERLSEIANFNAQSPWVKRGIGYQPVKFGICLRLAFSIRRAPWFIFIPMAVCR